MALFASLLLGALSLVGACAPESARVGAGGECFIATDCAPGLVCIEQPNKTRICTDDLSRVTGRAPSGGNDGGDEPDDDGGDSGDRTDSAPPPPPPPPPADGGADVTVPPDTGTPDDDAEAD